MMLSRIDKAYSNKMACPHPHNYLETDLKINFSYILISIQICPSLMIKELEGCWTWLCFLSRCWDMPVILSKTTCWLNYGFISNNFPVASSKRNNITSSWIFFQYVQSVNQVWSCHFERKTTYFQYTNSLTFTWNSNFFPRCIYMIFLYV